ncbi:MAG: glycoside hydrolase family 3 C-terminal domain-containing protein, partial [Candidatus Cryptobacteroides sp.]
MSAFNDNDGIPSTGNKWLLSDVLRGEWGFEGVVVSDWGSVGGLVPHGSARDKRDAARQCLEAGCDMDMMSRSYLGNLESLVSSGEVDEAVVDRAVRRVLRLKLELGLFDRPYTAKAGNTAIYSDKVRETACRLAEESSVLLKNDGILPLGDNVGRVLLTGPMADAAYDQMGTWALDGDKTRTVTPLKAMRNMLPASTKLVYLPVLDYPRQEEMTDLRRFRQEASKADVIIVFVGEEQMMSGEAHCLSDLHLQGRQSELIEIAAGTGKPVVAVIMAGRPLAIGRDLDKSSALLYMWHPGTMGGEAAVNLLWGKASPSGRLPMTFPRNEGQIPIYYNHKHTSHIAKGTEGNLKMIPREKPQSVMGHTSSYLDVPPTPLFPFGYGLTYTEFELSDISVGKASVSVSDTVEVSLTVTNTGKRKGVAVVQFYTGRTCASVTRPMKELKGFERVELEPAESRRITYGIPVESLSFCRGDMTWGVELGECYVVAGLDSAAGISVKFIV